MFLVLCIILFAIMAMAALTLWILDSLSLLYPSQLSTSSSSSSSVQSNGGELDDQAGVDLNHLSLAETALICDNSGLPSYEEAVKSGWTNGALDCQVDLCQ